MPSTIAWIDYDSEANQRAQRILTLFREKDTRDELGFGSIRDAISDTLFPGTSVIHTRLRYMLFLPWIYQKLEDKGVPSRRIADRARSEQLYLGQELLENARDEYGIIGRDIGEGLKTLPASIYWAGLGTWGLRTYPGTNGQYHRALDSIYQRRKRATSRRWSADEQGDDLGGLWEHGNHTWHPGLPEAPEDFPEGVTFDLTREEAQYLQEMVRHRHPDSLLAHLLLHPQRVSVAAPWEHPDIAAFSQSHRDYLEHAHNFSLIARGAALLYNQMLAEITRREETLEEHRESIHEWIDRFHARLDDLIAWQAEMPVFWQAVVGRGHSIGGLAQNFVNRWMEHLLARRDAVFDDKSARELVRQREIQKKGGNSRFTNQRMQDQWSGSSGLTPMTYRWAIVEGYINDISLAVNR